MSSLARHAVDAAFAGVLVACALLPFAAAFDPGPFALAAGGGLVIGAAIAWCGAIWRWHPLVVMLVTVVAFFAFGGVLAAPDDAIFGVIPTLTTLAQLAVGAVQVWRQVLTLSTPLDGFPGLTAAPYILALVFGTATISIAARARRPLWALLPAAVLMIASITLSTFAAVVPAAVGAAAAAIAVGWTVLVRTRSRGRNTVVDTPDGVPTRRGRAITLASAVTVILLTGGIGGVAAVALPLADRTVLRDHVVPPLDVRNYATPLTLFRKLETDDKDVDLFTISGLPSGASIRLATLDSYDGVVYAVSGSGGPGAGVFARVGRSISDDSAGTAFAARVTVSSLSGVWVPTVGYLNSLGFTGGDASEQAGGLHYNTSTGTAVSTEGVAEGDSYSMAGTVSTISSRDLPTDAVLSTIRMSQPSQVPDAVSTVLDTAVAGATTPVEQVRAVEAYLSQKGYFSNEAGLYTARSGHGLARENDLLGGKQMIGDDEQYSVAMALMLSQLGIPARVVMGFVPQASDPSTPVTIKGSDVHAWVEVPFDGYGWVSFTPTPSKDKIPQQEDQQQKQKPVAQIPQPPQTPQQPAQLPPAPPTQNSSGLPQVVDLSWLWMTLGIAGWVLLAAIIVLGPSVLLAIVQARRARMRRRAGAPADRVSGAWAEIRDAATDVGTLTPPGATRRESAAIVDAVYPTLGLPSLAQRADTAVFGAQDPTDIEIDAYWADVATARRSLTAGAPRWRRIRARVFPASAVASLATWVRSRVVGLTSRIRKGRSHA